MSVFQSMRQNLPTTIVKGCEGEFEIIIFERESFKRVAEAIRTVRKTVLKESHKQNGN